MKYSDYLKGLVGKNGSLSELQRPWFEFTIGFKNEDYQLTDVNDDYVIVQCNELPKMIDVIPLNLFQVRICQK